MEFGGAIRMSVKKERYWKSWAEDFGETFGPRTPDLLSKKLKELVKKNFTLYKLWGRALMYRTLYDMAKQSNHTNPKSYKFLEKIPEFKISNENCDWVASSNFRSPVNLPLIINS